ncbi:WAT1-related protein At1g09380-like [Cynara cardunculus var. scolymus]|uniref:WAT1-related protein At1g09380-like n=1 Tax=Cynara cardunculus var. scolymus TaxID=59895 RepID=UPI000D627317|nr:WAT1-related protein At1g09380-like [Cynara cardunculus var. scolymus]
MGTDALASLIMVIVQLEFAGMNILSKLAIDSGMNPFVHVAYRQMFASVVALPFAYFAERGKRLPMTRPIFIQIFFSSIVGMTVNQITYFVGLKNSTPTIACALSNLLPALTFILAVLFKQESARLKTMVGQAKVIGTFVSVGGAMLLSLYHGPIVPIGESGIHLSIATKMKNSDDSSQGNLIGSCLIIFSAFTWAVWFVHQAKMFDKYPAPYSSSALMLSMATIQSCLIGLVMEPSLHGWSLYPSIRAFSSIYAGIVCSAIALFMISWCIERKGPLFVSVFNPLLLIIVATLSWGLLQEKLYLGSVLGSMLIVGGLYVVLWGKRMETRSKVGVMDTQLKEVEQKGREDLEMP